MNRWRGSYVIQIVWRMILFRFLWLTCDQIITLTSQPLPRNRAVLADKGAQIRSKFYSFNSLILFLKILRSQSEVFLPCSTTKVLQMMHESETPWMLDLQSKCRKKQMPTRILKRHAHYWKSYLGMQSKNNIIAAYINIFNYKLQQQTWTYKFKHVFSSAQWNMA